jgi:hypothetical protein
MKIGENRDADNVAWAKEEQSLFGLVCAIGNVITPQRRLHAG